MVGGTRNSRVVCQPAPSGSIRQCSLRNWAAVWARNRDITWASPQGKMCDASRPSSGLTAARP